MLYTWSFLLYKHFTSECFRLFSTEFDLENDNDIKEDNSFNSEDDDDSVEEIEINSKCNKNIREKRNEEDEFDIKLDQDFIEIKKKLLSSKDY